MYRLASYVAIPFSILGSTALCCSTLMLNFLIYWGVDVPSWSLATMFSWIRESMSRSHSFAHFTLALVRFEFKVWRDLNSPLRQKMVPINSAYRRIFTRRYLILTLHILTIILNVFIQKTNFQELVNNERLFLSIQLCKSFVLNSWHPLSNYPKN